MRTFTIDQYLRMAKSFNKMSFHDKIKTIKENSDILSLASDGNWWGVKVKDKSIEDELCEMEEKFCIELEWGSSEMCDLIRILGIDNVDI